MPRLHRQLPWSVLLRSHSSVLRALIALVAVADVAAALYLWYLHGRGSRAGIHVALTALAPVRLLAAIALLAAALYLATRSKRSFQLVLILLAVAGALVALLSSHLPLVAIGVADALAALLAGSLWRGSATRSPAASVGSCSRLPGSPPAPCWCFSTQTIAWPFSSRCCW